MKRKKADNLAFNMCLLLTAPKQATGNGKPFVKLLISENLLLITQELSVQTQKRATGEFVEGHSEIALTDVPERSMMNVVGVFNFIREIKQK